MSAVVDLVRVGPPRPGEQWPCGTSTTVDDRLRSIRQAMASATDRGAEAILLLDSRLELPDPEWIGSLLRGSGDLWHGGLALGNAGRPDALDLVNPTWMLNLDPDAAIEATSWRVSLRCCLVRTSVIEHVGGPSETFDTLAGAALDLGLHAIRSGAVVRHVPRLAAGSAADDRPPTTDDGLRLVARHHGRRWLYWAAGRQVRHGGRLVETVRALTRARHDAGCLADPIPLQRNPPSTDGDPAPDLLPSVTILVPTLDRYPYLRILLRQLAVQTVPPDEVLIVDQTPVDRREADIGSWAPDLKVKVLTLPAPGQCTARNAGIAESVGDVILFVDDDDEIGPGLVEAHLRALAQDDVTASSGGVDEPDGKPAPPSFTHRRVSDVFPTNNTMLRRRALARSGLFDPAYDRGARADHDLGTRLYLHGALLEFDPEIRLFHHHAARGGLRTHGARRVTRTSSRDSLTRRHLPEVTQLYLWHRYYTDHQVREAKVISIVALLGHDGGRMRRVARAAVQVLLLADSVRQLDARDRAARALLIDRPPIPALPSRAPR